MPPAQGLSNATLTSEKSQKNFIVDISNFCSCWIFCVMNTTIKSRMPAAET